MGIPHLISKLDGFDDGDEVRIETENAHVVEGVIDWMDVYLDTDREEDRNVTVVVAIDEETADEIGSVWCSVSVGATRLSRGWSELDVTYCDDIEDGQERRETLGVVETIERID
ncbi:hypothetical protein [Halosimplex halobium]|uniref:hypothetical protein n=1 Tax=Halosimplex halobium TaxID=3396618 RepID=UPI003F577494